MPTFPPILISPHEIQRRCLGRKNYWSSNSKWCAWTRWLVRQSDVCTISKLGIVPINRIIGAVNLSHNTATAVPLAYRHIFAGPFTYSTWVNARYGSPQFYKILIGSVIDEAWFYCPNLFKFIICRGWSISGCRWWWFVTTLHILIVHWT
jgi:hypothetical protein